MTEKRERRGREQGLGVSGDLMVSELCVGRKKLVGVAVRLVHREVSSRSGARCALRRL